MARPYLVIPQAEFDGLMSKLELQFPVINRRFGKSVGWEKISERKAGNSLLQLTYIQKMERHALVWRFIFYRPATGWILDTFHYKDSLHPLFAE